MLSDKNWFEDEDPKKQRLKSRKSLGRRVSFAPDAHLETMHLYPKVHHIPHISVGCMEAVYICHPQAQVLVDCHGKHLSCWKQ